MELEYPESKSVETWQYKGMTLSVVKHPFGHYCGYVRMTKPTTLTDDEVALLYVHGSVTYGGEGSEVLGFDCAHWGDDQPGSPTKNLDWVKRQTEILADQLVEEVEPA